MSSERLTQQLAFIIEVDKLKSVLRQSYIANGSRRENDAEHTWHLCLMAVVLAEHANEPIDLLRVLKMLLVHDIVEIDAGDTFAYDVAGHSDKAEREEQAAQRLFGLLPADLAGELIGLFHEFEAQETAEAKFALSMDRLSPMMLNYESGGGGWKVNKVGASKVLKRVETIRPGSETLRDAAEALIHKAVTEGILEP
ncbi:MAG TPA: HD domain-containing protein [Symbiobacteriaceae bacterium]|nr:HD domain-containing protein [Symbiobacteriaceae bacterium]